MLPNPWAVHTWLPVLFPAMTLCGRLREDAKAPTPPLQSAARFCRIIPCALESPISHPRGRFTESVTPRVFMNQVSDSRGSCAFMKVHGLTRRIRNNVETVLAPRAWSRRFNFHVGNYLVGFSCLAN